MITLVAGTNRPDSMTLRVAQHYEGLFRGKGEEVQLLSLEGHIIWERGADLLRIEEQFLIPADRFAFIVPEYNGSFPGILKTLFDNSDIKRCWWGKDALLTGVADGRAGNLRGLEHLTGILHYLKMHVHPNKLPISRINEEMDEHGAFRHEATVQAIEEQVSDFLKR